MTFFINGAYFSNKNRVFEFLTLSRNHIFDIYLNQKSVDFDKIFIFQYSIENENHFVEDIFFSLIWEFFLLNELFHILKFLLNI